MPASEGRTAIRLTRAALVAAVSVTMSVGLAAPGSAGPVGGRELLRPSRTHVPAVLPPGFSDTNVGFTGLVFPTVMQFAADGRVFVGEKSGRVSVFDSVSDPTPTTVKDLSTNVYAADDSDRGLLGMALDPGFTTGNPYLYVLYTLDAPIGAAPPVFDDFCSDSLGTGCTVGARVSRFRVRPSGTSGPEQVLIEDWCQQFPSHSIGTLAFGPDGALYVGGGDGASFTFTDWGQNDNPCGDPTNEGGALRSQDLQTAGDPTGMNGSILRVDPSTGDALADNPLIGGDPSDDRIIAYGLRNPFRFAVKPGTDRIFVDDVGWDAWEEVDRIGSAADATVENFGWPCYEGKGKQPGYKGANLPICQGLYGQSGAVTKPILALSHGPGSCDGSNVMSGTAFYEGGSYPATYDGAYFITDVVRQCLWYMLPKANGDPNPSTLTVFGNSVCAVDIKTGPGGDLFYVDICDDGVHRITFA